MKKTVLHLSYDYADPSSDQKTNAVAALIDQVRQIANVQVISLDRVLNFKAEKTTRDARGVVMVKSFGLPLSLFLLANLRRAGHAIENANAMGLLSLKEVDVIHSHKISFEGYIGYLLAQKRQIPLFVTLRQTDTMLLRFRPDLSSTWRQILGYCSRIFYVVPSLLEPLRTHLGQSFFETVVKPKLAFLPNIVDTRVPEHHLEPEAGTLLTVFRMTRKSVHRKNVRRLLQALAALKRKDLRLDVIGTGSYLPVVQNWVQQYRIADQVRFLGPIANSAIHPYYARAQAFVLPSKSETFGYVYAEALLNGTPILYSRGTGFDGLFENVGVAVAPHQVESICTGLSEILARNTSFRAQIQSLKKNDAFRIFSPEYARATYQGCLN